MGGVHCEICDKRFKNTSLLTKHECKQNVISNNYGYNCNSCSKMFASVSNLKRHIKENHYTLAIEPQKKEDNKSINITNNINNGTINNITNNTTNNITIQPLLFVKHGEERIDHITKEFLLKLLNYTSAQKMFVELMGTLYFSSEVPENNNWSLAYPYNNKAAIVYDYDKNKFIRTSTEQIINDKFSNMIDKLVPMIDEINKDRDNLTRMQQINILHFYDKECVYDLSTKYPEIFELIRKLAYEQRYVPMGSWDEQGLNGKHLSLKFKPPE